MKVLLIISLSLNVLLIRLSAALVNMVKEAETDAQAARAKLNQDHDSV
jgi:hypothetical protein